MKELEALRKKVPCEVKEMKDEKVVCHLFLESPTHPESRLES